MPVAKRKSEDLAFDDRSGKKPKTVAQSPDSSSGHPSQPSPAEPQKQAGNATADETSEATMAVDETGTSIESEKKKGKRKTTNAAQDESDAPKAQIRKLAPARPFPTVPTSVSATGPRSAHVEGKNYICITRKTPLGAYLRRCKDAVIKAGHKTLHLHAMGAAIPHLLQLSLSLPEILPYAADEIQTEVLTGTVDVQDEVIPEDEDEDISLRTRGKSTLSIVVTIGDGKDEGAHTGKGKRKTRDGAGGSYRRAKGKGHNPSSGPQGKGRDSGKASSETLVYRASDMEM